ncbi:MAG: hypothetical protein LCH85_22425 [Chloroflexi bacterium]|nr:hypothetical protein [Chloroflexota bacterium]
MTHEPRVFAPLLLFSRDAQLSALLAVMRGYRSPQSKWLGVQLNHHNQALMSQLIIADKTMEIESEGYLLEDSADPENQRYRKQWEIMHSLVQAHPWTDEQRLDLVKDYQQYQKRFFGTLEDEYGANAHKYTEACGYLLYNLLSVRDLMDALGPHCFADDPAQWQIEAIMLNLALTIAMPKAFINELESIDTPRAPNMAYEPHRYWWHYREGYNNLNWLTEILFKP